jgi:uncharacterized protein (DUF1501 family)
MLDRRRFLQSSLLALAPAVPAFVARTARAAAAGADRRVLVVVQLDGGNDALNTVVPHTDPAYERLRPGLHIAKKDLIKLDDDLGLHPSLKALDPLLRAGQLAVVPGVGYPNPNRSHFESMAVWHTARLGEEDRWNDGWLGRALDPAAGTAYVIGGAASPALRGRRTTALTLARVEEALLTDPATAKLAVGPPTEGDLLAFVRRQAIDAHAAADRLSKLAKETDDGSYPTTGLAGRLRLAARLLKADLGARVFYTTQTGYDTHSGQEYTHANLLSEFAGAVAAFFADLKAAKLADRVTLLAFSEFGRTIRENRSGGTDHGTAGVVFLAGPGVRGGVCGASPSLTDLEEGEPKSTVDFRRVYATVLDRWLTCPSKALLGGTFAPLPVL